MLLDIQTHLQSLPFADIVVFFVMILFFGGLIAYSFVEEVEDLHKDDEEVKEEKDPIETIITGSVGRVFNHTTFDNLPEEDMD